MKSKVAYMVILFLLFVIPISEEALSRDLETIYNRIKWLEKTQKGNKQQIELAGRMIENTSYWLNRRDLLLVPLTSPPAGYLPVPRVLFLRRAQDIELEIRRDAFAGKITPEAAAKRLEDMEKHSKAVDHADKEMRNFLQEIKTNLQDDIKNINRSNEEIDREIAVLGRQIKSLQTTRKDLGEPATGPSSSVDRGTLPVPHWGWKLREGEGIYYVIDCKEIINKTGKPVGGSPRHAYSRKEFLDQMKTINNCVTKVPGRTSKLTITVFRREPDGRHKFVEEKKNH